MEPRADTPENEWEMVEKPAEQPEAETMKQEPAVAAPAAPESPPRKPKVSFGSYKRAAECAHVTEEGLGHVRPAAPAPAAAGAAQPAGPPALQLYQR